MRSPGDWSTEGAAGSGRVPGLSPSTQVGSLEEGGGDGTQKEESESAAVERRAGPGRGLTLWKSSGADGIFKVRGTEEVTEKTTCKKRRTPTLAYCALRLSPAASVAGALDS